MASDRFDVLANGLNLVLWEADWPSRRFTFVSPFAEALLGFPRDEWLEPGFWRSRVHPADRDFALALEAEQATAGRNFESEYRLQHADGHAVAVRDLVVVRCDAGGLPAGLSGVMVDVTAHRGLIHALADSEQRFRAVMEQVPNVSVQGYDRERRVVFWNSASERLYGYAADDVLGQPLEALIIPEAMRASLVALHRDWIDRGVVIPPGELTLQRRDGSPVEVFSSHVMTQNASGEPEMYCIDVELTEMRRAEAACRQSEARFRQTVDQAPVGICVVDLQMCYQQVNPRFAQIAGRTAAELVGLGVHQLIEDDGAGGDAGLLAACLRGERPSHAQQARLRRTDGAEVWVTVSVSLVRDADGAPVEFIHVVEDVTERRAAEAHIAWLAHHDPLTDLPNRTLFRDRLGLAINRARRSGRRAAVLFLDLDRFKTINDSLGHATGDQMLQAVARRLCSAVRDADTVCRLGGDEFLVVIDDIAEAEDAAVVARKLIDALATPLVVGANTLTSGASVGIALFPDDGVDVDTLMRSADAAMYYAKEAGRNTLRFYTEAMNATAVERLVMENALRQGLACDEFSLHYQPQVELATARVIGVEALLRWNSALLGPVSPARFIPVAEESGLIVQLGNWVLREACMQARRWRDMGLGSVRVAVNLSALQFRRTDIVATVRETAAACGVDAACLDLELTESLLMHNVDEVMQTMRALKGDDVLLSIDDFGTGYSSLSYLKRFPVDRLKIDRSFVADVADDPEDAAIVRAIIQLGRSLKLEVIAEGVETEAQVSFLAGEGCHFAQGYFFARPLVAEAATELLQAGRIARVAPV